MHRHMYDVASSSDISCNDMEVSVDRSMVMLVQAENRTYVSA
jgi:hypothetical protein